jgi:hypothetical protein
MSVIKPKFLNNTPIGDDLFEGKSQQTIGVIIADILKDGNFQIIGIDGAWGTGKSNLVKIVEKKIPEYKFFIYDVWGHQEDDQRKAILVELTEYISDKKINIISNKTKWKDKLKKLLSKEKETTTINQPYLSVGFIFSLFAIIYVPSVNVFKDDMASFFGIEKLLWKLLLVMFPLFIVLGIYVFNLIDSWIDRNGFWISFKLASQETFQVYTNKQKEETKIETITENEPSVKDFRNWMKEIDTDLGSNKLILVFDNFDRLPKKHILSIWSSIHIFFAEEKYKNIKVIIPFDRLHIQNAFKDLNGTNGDYADDYINKTFDIVYRVSPPILSSWTIYFEEQWKNAFSNYEELEFLKVLQIYETYRNTITPREIIAFINEVVSVKLLDDSIPDRYIALFVLNKNEILKDPLLSITNPVFLKGLNYLYSVDENFQKYITALAYQINPNDALEVAYRKQLKRCLVNNDVENFLEISKTNVFRRIINSVLDEIEYYQNPILVLDSLDQHSIISDIEKNKIWNDIFLKIQIIDDSFEIKDFQLVIMKHIEKNDSIKWLNKIIDKLKLKIKDNTLSFVEIIDEIDNFTKSNSLDINVFEILSEKKLIESNPESFIEFISIKKNDYKKYSVTISNEVLNEYLKLLTIEKIETSDYILYLKNDYDFEIFINELIIKIEANKQDPKNTSILLSKLKQISSKPIKVKLEDVDIYSLFTGINNKQLFYYDLIAMRLSKLNNFTSSYDSYFNNVLNSDDDELATKVAERIEYYLKYDEILIGSIQFTSSLLFKNVAKKIVINDYNSLKENIKILLENFTLICDNIGLEPSDFLNDLNTFEFHDLNKENVSNLPLELFDEANKKNNDLSIYLLSLADEYLTSLDKNQWLIVFKDFNNFNFKLLKNIGYNSWNSFAKEALKDILIEKITQKNYSDSEEWNYLIESFKGANISLNNVFKDIRDTLYRDSSYINIELFKILIVQFKEYSTLDSKPNESFRTFFKIEFLDNHDLLNLMIINSDYIKIVMQKSSPNDFIDFKQAILDRIEGNNEIKTLAEKLGLIKK